MHYRRRRIQPPLQNGDVRVALEPVEKLADAFLGDIAAVPEPCLLGEGVAVDEHLDVDEAPINEEARGDHVYEELSDKSRAGLSLFEVLGLELGVGGLVRKARSG